MTDRQAAARAYLSRIYYMDQKAEALKCELISIKKYAREGCRAVDEFNELINCESVACYNATLNAKKIIERVGGKYYPLLSYRYVVCMRWDEIEHQLHISESSRKRLHCEALDAVADVLEKLDLFEPLDPPYHGIRE